MQASLLGVFFLFLSPILNLRGWLWASDVGSAIFWGLWVVVVVEVVLVVVVVLVGLIEEPSGLRLGWESRNWAQGTNLTNLSQSIFWRLDKDSTSTILFIPLFIWLLWSTLFKWRHAMPLGLSNHPYLWSAVCYCTSLASCFYFIFIFW